MNQQNSAAFQNILCPVELDSSARLAANLAGSVARLSGGIVALLHVAHIPYAAMDSPVPIEPNPPWEQQARSELEKLAGELLSDVRYQILVRSGVAPHEILHAAVGLKADLIVMATHGRSGLNHLLMGSVAELVIRQATCPVMVTRPG